MPNNSLVQKKEKGFSAVINSPAYMAAINNTLKEPARANRFVASIVSAVNTTPALQECTPATIITAALLGEALNLSPSSQLGQFYLVPFKQKEKKDRNGNIISQACTNATFVLGYKGYIQLAIRSGQYKKLNVLPIKQGELISFNPLDEEITVNLIQDETVRENTETIGYYAMFEYVNGFKKAIYWTKEKMMAHADKYSAAFSRQAYTNLINGKIPQNELWKYSSFWYKDFDGMAMKTMLRQLISKWGIMSSEMEKAYNSDTAVLNNDGTAEYVDSPSMANNAVDINEIVINPEENEPTPQEQPVDEFAQIMGG